MIQTVFEFIFSLMVNNLAVVHGSVRDQTLAVMFVSS